MAFTIAALWGEYISHSQGHSYVPGKERKETGKFQGFFFRETIGMIESDFLWLKIDTFKSVFEFFFVLHNVVNSRRNEVYGKP